MNKYAIYLRKSRADLEAERYGEGETLTKHREILLNFAKRKHYHISQIYQEIVSGETIDARPEIQRLIKDCYNNKYKGVLVVDVTRLSRGNQGDAQTILDCLRYSNLGKGVLVITPTKTYDIVHNSEDEEYMEFELFMSRREYKMIAKRLERGKNQSVIEGNYVAPTRPYGYNIVKTKRSRTLVPNESEALVVKQIFELWNSGLSTVQISHMLGDEISDSAIRYIIANPVYAGKVRWNNRLHSKKMVGGELITTRISNINGENYLLTEGKHPAIISWETFENAQSRFENARTKRKYKLDNPLAGLLVCAKCGYNMRHHKFRERKSIPPRYYHKSGVDCYCKSAFVSDVMNSLAEALKQNINDCELQISGNVDTMHSEKEKTMLQSELKQIEKKIAKLFDAWENENISDDEFASRKEIHTKRATEIKVRLEEIEAAKPQKEKTEQTVRKLSDALNALADPSVSAEDKNKFLKRIISKVEFSCEQRDVFELDIYLK